MYYTVNSLILKSEVVAEADKLLTMYTKEWGKIYAVAPGAKKIKAKLGAATEPVVECEMMVYLRSPNARPKITGARILNNYSALKCDWKRLAIAQSCSEICSKLAPINLGNDQKYILLARTWNLLQTAENPWRIFIAFTLRFLRLSGYSFTDYIKSGSTSINTHEKSIIMNLATNSGEAVDSDNEISPQAERNIFNYIDSYLNYYLPYPLSSKRFWQKIKAMENEPVYAESLRA